MTTQPQPGHVSLDSSTQPARVRAIGDWTLAHYTALEREVTRLRSEVAANVSFDLSQLGALDTAGAALLAELLGAERLADLAELEPGLPRERQALLKTVGHALHDFCEPEKPKPPTTAIELLARIGCAMETFWLHLKALLGFIGLTLETLFRSLVRPASWRVTPLVANIEKSGLDAVPIIALLTFLVGAVIAFLGATVLANFGATIYTVNLVVFSFLREFAVLLTAILMAGRTASAFTAQIGSMKANEEIDAIRALGLNPIELLVLPRVLALLVSLPMLTFVGMLCGLWLAKSGSEGKFNYYDIVFNEAVSGLSQGSSVQYSGIKVGDVAFLRLDPKDPRKVWARIRVVASAPIKQDTTAKLALTGITGTSIIQLSSGTPASPMLEGKDGKIPVIVATPSPLTQLLSNGEDLMGNINQLIARFSNLLSEENTARISRTLDHLDQATGALSAERENVSAVMQQLAQASRQANAALAQASELMRSANGLLNEQGKGMLENANKTMASLERTSATLDQLISENRHSLDGGIQGLAELGPAVSELRDTLAALRGISRRLEENPANYLLGREKTKEFTP